MAKKKRHSKEEIAAKLAQARELAARGELQSDIARTLGVSVMTLHRWRNLSPPPGFKPRTWHWRRSAAPTTRPIEPNESTSFKSRIRDCRRLVTDLPLEKMKLEEALAGSEIPNESAPTC